ncbi:glycosyltransferase family 2 protein [Novosphingobium sp. HII-3]|uniref:glycosyltransferase family 2 protein n=1 Tax=Novosphingobium sp. HII-3 TaxID=2075565 RepID=UPI000CDA8172|nr:glycosyltransferase family 2 protein [Novosphingobium sp. HII-3]
MQESPRVTLSIVSHGQGDLIRHLLGDLRRLNLRGISIILTLNIPEDEGWLAAADGLPIRIIRNERPLGFGANHNQAFACSTDTLFCVVNPDIRLPDDGLVRLPPYFADQRVAACAPLVVGSDGEVQDSARRFPNLLRLARRVVLRQREADYAPDAAADVDWVAGMLVLFRREAFAQVGGFDEGYFMYLEDADICRRLRRAGWKTVYQPSVTVVHDARRDSHRSLRHLRWHMRSMIRFLTGF